jgi:Caspase domain/TIR domain
MANATRRLVYHLTGMPLADWFFRAGYFDEVVLLMDCCQERYEKVGVQVFPWVDLTAPEVMDRSQRFYGLAAQWSKRAREREFNGVTRGVFTAALLAGVRGAACDPTTARTDPMSPFADAHALVVGIDEYLDPGLALPQSVRNDAREIAGLLTNPARCGYDEGRVELLLGRKATRAAILSEFEKLGKVGANSTVVLYFSCHGHQLDDGEYLLPADADLSTAARARVTAISAAVFSDKVKAISARKLLVVLDCCHAAGVAVLKGRGVVKAGLGGDLYDRLNTGTGRAVLAACAPGEQAVVLKPDDPHSLFTTHLLDGLRGKAAADDGLVKVLGLFEYVQLGVTGQYRAQHPVLKADLQDNFPVARNNGREKGVAGREPNDTDRYDAFIAHADADFDWVFRHLVPALAGDGLRHTVSADALGQYRVTAVEDAIIRSKYVLLIVSPNYTADRLTQLAGILGQDFGLQTGRHRVIPVKIGEPAEEVRLGIRALVGVDLSPSAPRYDYDLARLLRQLHREPRTM